MYKSPEAAREYQRKWRSENKVRMAELQRQWRLRNPAKVRASAIRWRTENKEKFAAMKKAWRDANPDKVFAEKQRYRKRHADKIRLKNRRYQQQNRQKVRAWLKKHRAKHPERVRDLGRIYRQNRRALMAGGKLPTNLPQRLLVAQKHRCAYCPTDLRKSGYHLDHKTPLSRDGAHEEQNIQLTCPICNLSKFTMTDEEFRAQLPTAARSPS
jgi:5-methylcytosine-specific restriction endonuclease McrA